MKTLFIFTLVLILSACKNDYFLMVNRRLDSNFQKKNGVIESFYNVRKKIFNKGFLSFISEKDTIFILSDYHIESSTHYGSIWTKNKSFHYSYNRFVNKNLINEIIIDKTNNERGNVIFNLISKWDTTKIRYESNVNYNQLFPSHVVSAYRVYKPENKIIIDKIIFRPFY
jgi:hypothetical protein